ncbi:MAG: protein adenylyltransferase SelO family protein, partial [Pseudomonadota bacterium]
AAAVLADAARNIAHMAAEWYVAGFVHGVLNTDNTTLTGESFDYGPWRLLPTLDVTHTAAYFDQTGLYAFGRQPGALHWNLQRLADCLLPNSTEAALTAALNTFGDHFEARLTTLTLARLGRAVPADGDLRAASELVQSFYRTLHDAQLPFEQTFFDLFGLDEARWSKGSAAEAFASGDWPALLGQLAALPDADGLVAARATDYFAGPAPETLVIDEVEALWAPIAADDNWQPLNAKLDRIRAMGSAYAPLLPPRAGHVPIG